MKEWAIIWIGDILPDRTEGGPAIYHVDWYHMRSDAIARRRELLDSGTARGAWLVHCPPAIIEMPELPRSGIV